MSNKKMKGANGASHTSRFAENVDLADLSGAAIEIAQLSALHETYGTRSAWLSLKVQDQIVRSWVGGTAIVLKVEYQNTSNQPRWSLLLKITKEDDAAFWEQCGTINKLLRGAVRTTASLSFAQPSVPFSPVDDGEAYLFNCRVTLDAQGKSPSMLLSKTGKAVQRGFEVLRPGMKINLVKLTMPSIYISSYKPEGAKDEEHRARLTVCLKKAQLLTELQDLTLGGKKRKAVAMSCADLIEAGSD